eukprot:5128332-Pleurochrysis_carterae.AAC.5
MPSVASSIKSAVGQLTQHCKPIASSTTWLSRQGLPRTTSLNSYRPVIQLGSTPSLRSAPSPSLRSSPPLLALSMASWTFGLTLWVESSRRAWSLARTVWAPHRHNGSE